MEEYRITLRPAALRELRTIDAATKAPIVEAIRLLSRDVRPTSSRRLWRRASYRMTVDDYQVFYTIDVNELSVVVVTVQPLLS
jgi:mRNA-degrading endonuclease RelE of RelBE toxin-antitoxin system